MPETGNYINGSDILLKVDGKAVGHCSTHTLTFNSETKDRAVKPVATAAISSAAINNNHTLIHSLDSGIEVQTCRNQVTRGAGSRLHSGNVLGCRPLANALGTHLVLDAQAEDRQVVDLHGNALQIQLSDAVHSIGKHTLDSAF